MDLQSQLNALQDRNLINQQIVDIVFDARHYLIETWQVDVERPQVISLLIHLANSLGRTQRQRCVSPLHKDFLYKIQNAECFPTVLAIHQGILALIPISIHENEQSYFLANYYTMLLDQPEILK
ncbi:hypothetical protein GVX81_08585 [[Haemophilus] felis]|uniref:PRD domain-containing protein n=1 Tax=[Haemophilus] felis TaxID=123822 RepID=A0A1T0AV90_9PAST|nr:hypothetical protein [[Haemophilus] felis]NBI41355.1 hypothetical protein [[Haemophilus] felis]OOS00203.1 hypothetical protein B0188_10820 [[Haemophilus] felis]